MGRKDGVAKCKVASAKISREGIRAAPLLVGTPKKNCQREE